MDYTDETETRKDCVTLTEKTIERVRALTFQIVKGHTLDRGDIEGQVLLDCVRRGLKPTRLHVQRRVWDALAKRHQLKTLMGSTLQKESMREYNRKEHSLARELDIESLTQGLSAQETRVIAMRFWDKSTLEEIAQKTCLTREKVMRVLQGVLDRMREKVVSESYGE